MIKYNRETYLKTRIVDLSYIGQRVEEVGLQEIKKMDG